MKAEITAVWFNVGEDTLTLKSSSPLYREDDWRKVGGAAPPMTAYSPLGDDYQDLIDLVKKETGLSVVEYDTQYSLQIQIEIKDDSPSIPVIRRKIERWAAKHFELFQAEPYWKAKNEYQKAWSEGRVRNGEIVSP